MKPVAVVFLLTLHLSPWAHAKEACPKPVKTEGATLYKFSNGAIAIRTGTFNVNPDGARSAYTVGDHGFTYIANGVDLYVNGQRRKCTRDLQCGTLFQEAAERKFAKGTREFCAYGIKAEAFPGGRLTPCGGGAALIGNGKGKPVIGDELTTVTGDKVLSYQSLTTLSHKIAGKISALDSETIPTAVIPKDAAKLIGKIVWVRAHKNEATETLAIAGDTGNAFNEGSIALHQLLAYQKLIPQKTGPIPAGLRCGPEESALQAPFNSAPDKAGDTCQIKAAHPGNADIRAYTTMQGPIDLVILPDGGFQVADLLVDEEVSIDSIRAKFQQGTFTEEKIREMAACMN